MSSPEETGTGPVIRDLRRIDPVTGQVRSPGQGGSAQPGGAPRGPGKPSRPGRHAASKPGGAPGAETGTPGKPGSQRGSGQAGTAGRERAAAGEPASQERAARPAGPQAPSNGGGQGEPSGREAEVSARLAERTADLQRVTAEYANYRKRVDRDRLAVREQALANVLIGLVPVLDDIGRAREHGELVGGFKSVADSLESATTKLGLTSFGDVGEPFDPTVHEALTHSYSSDVTEPTCVAIFQPGYKVGERILRPARVAVAEPEETPEPGGAAGAGDTAAGEAGTGDDGPAEPDGPGAAEAQGNREEDN
jgi:molecular chaperone GrpE